MARARTNTAKKPRAKRDAPSAKEPTPRSARAPRARIPSPAAAKRPKPEKPRESPSVRAIKAAMAEAPSEHSGEGPDAARMKDFDWDDGEAPVAEPTELYNRWSERGDDLTRRLAELGVDERLYEVDLRAGRIAWVDGEGGVLCEARAQLICCHHAASRRLVMAWADPVLASLGAEATDGMQAERDDLDDLGAWVAAMRCAEACGAEFLYRVPGALASHFLALRHLRRGDAAEEEEGAGAEGEDSPVGLVLSRLEEARRALDPREVRADDARDRLARAGADVTKKAETTYRDTEWSGRLARTGRLLLQLSGRVARPTYTAIAMGRSCEELVDIAIADEMRRSVALLVDEWAAFG
jgi:hypothetical protein